MNRVWEGTSDGGQREGHVSGTGGAELAHGWASLSYWSSWEMTET